MLNLPHDTFTDRREALALFDLVRGRDGSGQWPLLPLLSFIGPEGSGKSTLIERLRATICLFEGGRSALPHVSIDFTVSNAPKDFLDILIFLRNALRSQPDGDGKHLVFPRFDLGAAIAAAFATNEALVSPSRSELQRHLTQAHTVFTSIGEMGNALGNLIAIIPPLINGIKIASTIPPLSTLVKREERQIPCSWWWAAVAAYSPMVMTNRSPKNILLLNVMRSLTKRRPNAGRVIATMSGGNDCRHQISAETFASRTSLSLSFYGISMSQGRAFCCHSLPRNEVWKRHSQINPANR
jgi:hypothetical protein